MCLTLVSTMKQTQNEMNYHTLTYKGIELTVQNTDWGWFVEVSDGYESEYFATKKEAIAKRSEIKREIKNGTW